MVGTIVIHNKKKVYWWNFPVKTLIKFKPHRHDLMTEMEKRNCVVVEISYPVEYNIKLNISEKAFTNGKLVRKMQLHYPDNNFKFISGNDGSCECVTQCLDRNLEKLVFSKHERRKQIGRLSIQPIIGTIKICKTRSLSFKHICASLCMQQNAREYIHKVKLTILHIYIHTFKHTYMYT